MDDLLLRFRDDAQLQPFMVLTAGRSRTMWLSAFLTYGVCACHFEAVAKVGSFQEIVTMLSIPGMGSAETMAAPAWPLLLTAAPQLRIVVVRRPREEIVTSLARRAEGIELDVDLMHRMIGYLERALDKVSKQPQVLTVQFKDLEKEETCRAVFEHCLPYKHDKGWWDFMREKKLDPDPRQLGELYRLREKEIRGLGRECRHLLFKLGRQGHFQHLGA